MSGVFNVLGSILSAYVGSRSVKFFCLLFQAQIRIILLNGLYINRNTMLNKINCKYIMTNYNV